MENIHSLTFNQDGSCFVVSTSIGMRVYNTNEFYGVLNRNFDGGINYSSMYYRSNLIAIVGSHDNIQFNQKKVVLWDDQAQNMVGMF